MVLTGPDCSRHQGNVDWTAVAGAGHDFAIIKATDGVAYSYTGWFLTHFRRVKAAGLVPGAYHFLLAGHDGAAQARFYVDTVEQAGGFDGVLAVLDVETGPGGGRPDIDIVRAFAAEFRRLVPGHPLIIYTGAWYWRGTIGNPLGVDLGPLWHSEYETTQAEVADGPESLPYGGWARATIWQWTSTGSCPGVAGNCDLNRFDGDRSALLALTTGDDDMDDKELADALANGSTRPVAKKLIQGAVLDGLREPVDGRDDRGSLRPVVAEIVAEQVAPLARAVARLSPDVDEAALAAVLLPGIVQALDVPAIVAAVPKAVRAELAAALAADPD